MARGKRAGNVRMSASVTYLDHNASAPLLPEAREAVLKALEMTGNPSSVHGHGRALRALVDESRAARTLLGGTALRNDGGAPFSGTAGCGLCFRSGGPEDIGAGSLVVMGPL